MSFEWKSLLNMYVIGMKFRKFWSIRKKMSPKDFIHDGYWIWVQLCSDFGLRLRNQGNKFSFSSLDKWLATTVVHVFKDFCAANWIYWKSWKQVFKGARYFPDLADLQCAIEISPEFQRACILPDVLPLLQFVLFVLIHCNMDTVHLMDSVETSILI